MIGGWSQESDSFPRRDFLRGGVLAAGVILVTPVLKGQIEMAVANGYGLYGRLQAQTGKGKELGELLLKAANLLENAKGCILYVVSRIPDEPDGVYVFEVWANKDDHDNSLKLSGVRELISQARLLLAGKPEGTTFEVLGGKGLG